MILLRLSGVVLAATVTCAFSSISHAVTQKKGPCDAGKQNIVETRSVGVVPDFDAIDVEKIKPGKYRQVCITAQDKNIKFRSSKVVVRPTEGSDMEVAMPDRVEKGNSTGWQKIPGKKSVSVKQIRVWYETEGGISLGTAKAVFYVK